MADRIVVSLHLPVEGAAAAGYLRRALAAKKRAEALGAALSAWSPDGFAFDFAPDEVEKAVDLALATFDDASLAEPRFSSGIAFGELSRVGAGSLAMLAWGEPLVASWRLARAGGPGEVLIDERCPPHIWQALRTHGEHRAGVGSPGALALDTRQPFRRDTFIDSIDGDGDAKVRVTVPPLPPIQGLPRDFYDRQPASRERHGSDPPPTVRNDAPAELESPASAGESPASTAESPGSVTIADSPASAVSVPVAPALATPVAPLVSVPAAPPVSAAAPSVPPPSAEVPSAPAPSAPDLPAAVPSAASSVVPPARFPVPRSAPSVPPPSLGGALRPATVPPASAARLSWPDSSDDHSELAAAARQALLKGNVAELERLADELRTRGEHGDLAERMAGFVAWNRGAKAEGLRKLRAAADAETRPAHRVRALLAYGVALASSGRPDAALLAGLGAIARAREVADRQGEHVCARFLARLSAAAGYERAAHTWAAVAEEARTARSA
jgi:hypothetical protein